MGNEKVVFFLMVFNFFFIIFSKDKSSMFGIFILFFATKMRILQIDISQCKDILKNYDEYGLSC